ncbi:hypothetical protein V6N12_075942 [Hibiscus sabdariffa]|uniref:Uncharacterized protein n=1 Tax=Hibiscus sabdariffa TaxID=183260 RepID=A0ABR2AXT8_9ROSI
MKPGALSGSLHISRSLTDSLSHHSTCPNTRFRGIAKKRSFDLFIQVVVPLRSQSCQVFHTGILTERSLTAWKSNSFYAIGLWLPFLVNMATKGFGLVKVHPSTKGSPFLQERFALLR